MKAARRLSVFFAFLMSPSVGCTQPSESETGSVAGRREQIKAERISDENAGGVSIPGDGWNGTCIGSVVGLNPSTTPDGTFFPPNARFVAQWGDDDAPGTENEPWRDLLSSLQRLKAGDTLVIRGGTYAANGSSALCGNGTAPFGLIGVKGDERQWTTIMGYPGERPKLYHADGWQTLYICESSYVKVAHLEIFGDASVGGRAPASGLYIVRSHHILVEDVWSHDNGGCGLCSSESNHITIRRSRAWGNSLWNEHQTSGISIFRASNDGGGDNPDGYSNYIIGNSVWNNRVDDSLGIGRRWGVTDGNGIIIDNNNDSVATGRTLIQDNVIAANGGPGVMVTRSHSVDIIHNTLFKNVGTRVESVVNNGEIGCNGGYDLRIESNIVVARDHNPNLFQDFSCRSYTHANNVWVRTGAPRLGSGDIVLPSDSTVIARPKSIVPEGDWTAVGSAKGRGARVRPLGESSSGNQ